MMIPDDRASFSKALSGLVGAFAATAAVAGPPVWTSHGPYGGRIDDLAIHPGDADSVYLATPAGVFQTADGGLDWTHVSFGASESFCCQSVAIDPHDPVRLIAGAGNGTHLSTDGGASWTLTTALWAETTVFDPTTQGVVYAETNLDGVIKSVDGGATWSEVNTGLPAGSTTHLAIAPSSPSTLYVSTILEVYKTTDAGGSWTAASTGLPGVQVQGLAVDPLDPDVVYAACGSAGVYKTTTGGASWAALGASPTGAGTVLADPSAANTVYAATSSPASVERSGDGGSTWTAIDTGLSGFAIRALGVAASSPATLYAGSGSLGVFRTTDSGASWALQNQNLANVLIWDLAVDPLDALKVYAAADAGVFRTADGGATWTLSTSGFVFNNMRAVAVDASSPATIYAGGGVGGVYKSIDSGATWAQKINGLTELSPKCVVVDPFDSQKVYSGTSSKVFRSTDGAASWAAGSGLSGSGFRSIVVDPSNTSVLYTSADGLGGDPVFRSIDGGATWSPRSHGIWDSKVHDLAIDAVTPLTLYAAGSSGFFSTLDAGASWQVMDSALFGGLEALASHPSRPGMLYAAARFSQPAALYSFDGGASWAPSERGLEATAGIKDLGASRSDPGVFYAATTAGVFRIDLCPLDLALDGFVATFDEHFIAGSTITTGPSTVVETGGSLTLEAGERVVLGEGTEIEAGAELAIALAADPCG